MIGGEKDSKSDLPSGKMLYRIRSLPRAPAGNPILLESVFRGIGPTRRISFSRRNPRGEQSLLIFCAMQETKSTFAILSATPLSFFINFYSFLFLFIISTPQVAKLIIYSYC